MHATLDFHIASVCVNLDSDQYVQGAGDFHIASVFVRPSRIMTDM